MYMAKEDLKKHMQFYMKHPFAKEYIKPIEIEDVYYEFITAVLAKKNVPYQTALQYGTAVLLAYTALRIHDELDYQKMDQNEKQLTILIGAYYTSLYYENLSQMKDTAFIRCLAKGIAKQSETRMQHTQIHFTDVDAFLRKKADADWIIFQEVLDELQLDEHPYLYFKYKFLELSVKKAVKAKQSGAHAYSFYPNSLDDVYQEMTNQILVDRVESFLENL